MSVARATLARRHAQERARLSRTFNQRERKQADAIHNFRPRKSDRGRIIFIGSRGGRLPPGSARRGYAVYINTKGRKSVIRQLSKTAGRVEKTAIPRKLTGIDVSRLRAKRAKQRFLTARLNPVARAELRKKGRKGVASRGTRYAGNIVTDKFYENSDSVTVLSKELVRAVNSTRSKKDFLVTIGISVKDGEGRFHWIELSRRFSRQDRQKADVSEVRQYFGKEIYAFLARELADRDLVLSGSARHIGRLKENRGRKRDSWTKDGFLWQGHDMNDVTIDKLEYRFDQLTLTK